MAILGVEFTQFGLSVNQHVIYDDLSIAFEAGKTTCILGTSGVGKSLLLKSIVGLLTAPAFQLSGSIAVELDGCAYMGQTDGLLPWLTCLDNTLLAAKLNHSITKAERQKAIDILIKIGLGDALEKRPDELSGGMKQRVALARTLMQDKPIVLMDEPFSALDAITKLKLQDLTAELLANKTVILVTHDPMEALRLGHAVYVLSGSPVKFESPIYPEHLPPRKTTDASMLMLQGELLSRLEQQ